LRSKGRLIWRRFRLKSVIRSEFVNRRGDLDDIPAVPAFGPLARPLVGDLHLLFAVVTLD
jgi:hypothetical protein